MKVIRHIRSENLATIIRHQPCSLKDLVRDKDKKVIKIRIVRGGYSQQSNRGGYSQQSYRGGYSQHSNRGDYQVKPPNCFRCKEDGHVSSDMEKCKLYPTCHRCGMKGHKIRLLNVMKKMEINRQS
jgi:hypothetical protein